MAVDRYRPPARSGLRFLSLKWKVLLMLGGVLLSVNGALSWLHFQDLTSRFELQRAATRERLMAQAFALRSEFGLRLQALAGMLAALDDLRSDLSQNQAGGLLVMQHFDSYWSALQLDFGIDSLQVYARNGQPLADWRNHSFTEVDLDAHVRTVIAHERAMHWTRCGSLCTQFAAAPILAQGRVAGAVVLGSSLADVVVSFNRLSGADLGVLTRMSQASNKNSLSRLSLQVVGLSRAERNLPLLEQLATLPAVPAGGSAWRLVAHDGSQFEVSFLSLDAPDVAPSPALLVIIDDVTEALANIRKSVWNRLQGELLASVLALLLLALLVNAPLQRMTRAVRAIPLLGRSAFAEARARIVPRGRRFVDDEIDSLDEAAIALSYRLETLEREVEAHSADMQGMLQRISIERDFSRSLLDTAQVIILTQHADGRIVTLNRYGRMLSGWQEDDLPGKRFFELVCPEGSAGTVIHQALQRIAAGDRQHVQLESILAGTNGRSYEITWNHSRLSGRPGEPVMILSVGIDHTERKRAELHVSYLAEHDPLTGLANRQHFQRELDQALVNARLTGLDGALLYLDLDGFKYVNDLSGHQAGDSLLRIVATEVSQVARPSDLLGRLGGDELGVLLHECDREVAIEIAEEINRRLAEIRFAGLGAKHRVSASIGIVVFSGARMDVKQLLANADIAMYQAKSKGGAGWHLYSEGEGVQEKMQSRLYWEEEINRALSENRLIVHYQPILDMHARQVSHYEALVRMLGPDGSPILPGAFMEVAENSGLIREIDRQVIRLVGQRMQALSASGRHFKFSINLSGLSINDTRLLAFIRDEFAHSPPLLGNVVFEITETAAVSDFPAARSFIHAVRELGCAFSLDDFGVGFSSFNYIKQLPIDYVKIDGSFVRTLVDSPDDQVFVRALAEVARGFGKKTVAEFVEDERTLNMLRTFGVDYAQGYHIGKPQLSVH
ncbi:MAG: EAL domain-containing protein [Candidatus Accumulibacter sp.]|uniref:bifunctional diguanylate cyclase/phosphodiesterase n=1 Tax=Accumulibacter sp. TaxID=2053492 RepID=UPI00287965CF|nr:EAL domain-containing protein [Accumulibacter sp.]MDS4015134.1 EAL domain-containing protein [Accumulibacter sp.]